MVHFILPPGRTDAVLEFKRLAEALGLKEADFSEPGFASFSHYQTVSDGEIERFESAGFIRADVHVYQILPPPQTDLEFLNLIRAFSIQKPSTVVRNGKEWVGMLLYFTNMPHESDIERAKKWGFTITYMRSNLLKSVI